MSPPWNGDNWPRTVYDLCYNVMKSPQIKYSQKCGDKCLPTSAAFKMAAGRCISIFFIALRFVDVSWTLLVSMKWRKDKLTKKSQARMSGLWKRLRLVLKKFLLLFFLKVCGICSLEAAKKRSLQYDLRLLHFFAWIIDHDFRTRVFGWVNRFREYRV